MFIISLVFIFCMLSFCAAYVPNLEVTDELALGVLAVSVLGAWIFTALCRGPRYTRRKPRVKVRPKHDAKEAAIAACVFVGVFPFAWAIAAGVFLPFVENPEKVPVKINVIVIALASIVSLVPAVAFYRKKMKKKEHAP